MMIFTTLLFSRQWMSIYMIFLLLLGLGLFLSESWGKRADYAIKLAVLVITLCYAIEELDQIIK